MDAASDQPPRRVPFSAAASLLFGGVISQLAWGFVVFGVVIVVATFDLVVTPAEITLKQLALLLFWFFPLVGLIVGYKSIRAGWTRCDLLRHGRICRGELIEKEATNVSVNDAPVYRLRFRYYAAGRQYHVDARSHDVASIEDEATERVLYLPQNPHIAAVIDNLPGKIAVSDQDAISASALRGVAVLVLPTLAVTLFVLSLGSRLLHCLAAGR